MSNSKKITVRILAGEKISDKKISVINAATVIGHLLLLKMLAKLCLLGRISAGIEVLQRRNVAVAGYAGTDPP